MLNKLSLKSIQPITTLTSKLQCTTSQPILSSLYNNKHNNTNHTQHTHQRNTNQYRHYVYGATLAATLTGTALYSVNDTDNNTLYTYTSKLFNTAYADSNTIPDTLPIVTPTQYNTQQPQSTITDLNESVTTVPIKRSKLKNPGKFDHAHRESQSILNLNVHPGASLRYAQPMYLGTDEERITGNFEKQMTFLPAFMLGGQEGSGGQLHVITQLGQRHELRAMIDNNFNLTGKYKHTSADKKWSQKAEFTLVPQQNGLALAADYKGKDFTAQFNIVQMQEITLSYSQSITPYISLGTELTHVLGMVSFIGAQARYLNESAGVHAAATYKVGSYHASYARAVSPTLSLATEVRYNPMNKESMWQVGMLTRRPNSFTYQAAIQSNLTTLASLEIPLVPGIAFEINGAMSHDGSNESTFGFGLSIG